MDDGDEDSDGDDHPAQCVGMDAAGKTASDCAADQCVQGPSATGHTTLLDNMKHMAAALFTAREIA
jgi:hypothetical protein